MGWGWRGLLFTQGEVGGFGEHRVSKGGGRLTGGDAGLITDDSCWCHSVQISYGVRLGKALFT